MTIFRTTALGLAAALALSVAGAHAADNFGRSYQPVAAVGEHQAQIVFMQDNAAAQGSANVYIDGEYHSALLPGGFTTFCVAPGSHTLGAFVNDAPSYQGKRTQPWRTMLEGGKTYFMKVSQGQNGMPEALSRRDAERALQSMRLQSHTLSRASAVEACQYLEGQKEYTLSGDVLFRFGRSDRNSITSQGQKAVNDLVSQIQREHSDIRSIQVIGHTDPIGSEAANAALGQSRADTVRQLMIEAGVPARTITASSVGMSQPVVETCSGSIAEQITCYAPNRRVAVSVDGSAAQ